MAPFPGGWGSDISLSLGMLHQARLLAFMFKKPPPWGMAALKSMSFPVKYRISELSPKMKETHLSQPKIVIKLLK